MGLELDYIFHPSSIAVVGVSPDQERGGLNFFRLLLEFQFPGPVYPINLRGQEVLGIKAYKSLKEIPGPVDYVISCISARGVLELLDDCAAKGVKAVHFFTARFSETGHEEGARLERELVQRARRYGIRFIGPNCMGLYCPGNGLTFKPNLPREAGPVAFLSQSGGNAVEVVYAGARRGLRFSKVISYGNATDLNEADYMDYLAQDPETQVIGAYVEGVKDGSRFFQSLRKAAQHKPVVLHKGGRTPAGRTATASHTASLAGSHQVWEALCRQAGAISVPTLDELIDLLVAFRFLRPTTGYRTGVAGAGGGRMVFSADECEEAGLQVIPIPPAMREAMRQRDPDFWDWVQNPVDVSILQGSKLPVDLMFNMMAEDPNFDMLICDLNEHFALESPAAIPRTQRLLDTYLEAGRRCSKPLAVVSGDNTPRLEWLEKATLELRQQCIQAGAPLFPTIGRAALALSRLVTYYRQRDEI